ncbi:MAG: hypothetical protein KKH77_01150 [Candidatus Omnitrophica bacterium]|nr:hypothetical protein [Candidatus Omnitrophota bacterium]MBU1808067.1 hypothetical protein [Candidatus Omnitrophota bacterium]
MQCDAFMEESLCYKATRDLYSCFIASLFFKIFAGSARSIYRISGEIIHNSDSRRLFISSYSACRGKARYFILASAISILLCHIFIGLLTLGEVNYIPISLFCAALFVIYLVKKGVIKHFASIYSYSYISRLINKRI